MWILIDKLKKLVKQNNKLTLDLCRSYKKVETQIFTSSTTYSFANLNKDDVLEFIAIGGGGNYSSSNGRGGNGGGFILFRVWDVTKFTQADIIVGGGGGGDSLVYLTFKNDPYLNQIIFKGTGGNPYIFTSIVSGNNTIFSTYLLLLQYYHYIEVVDYMLQGGQGGTSQSYGETISKELHLLDGTISGIGVGGQENYGGGASIFANGAPLPNFPGGGGSSTAPSGANGCVILNKYQLQ
jgi:hypothetical protein